MATPPKIWPFTPNWSTPVTVVPEYKTDIITTRSGREQRRALRSSPRKTVSFSVALAREDMRRFVRWLQSSQNQSIVLPDPTRRVSVLTVAGATATVDRVPAWLADGQVVIAGTETRTVVSTTSGTVTLNTAVAVGTVIRPALSGKLAASIQGSVPTDSVITATVDFIVDPGSEIYDPGDPDIFIHNGREVFVFRANWSDGLTFNFNWATEDVDFGFGRTQSYTPVDFGSFLRTAQFIRQGVDEIEAVRDFFDRMKGRRGEFYLPTGTDDIPLTAGLVTDGTTLTTPGTGIFDDYDGSTVMQAICVKTRDGRLLFRSVTAMAVIDGNTVLTLNAPWVTDVTLPEILMVSWMPVFRFGSDGATFEWPTDGVVQTQLAMQSLQDLTPEGGITGYDGAALWVLENWGPLGVLLMDLLQRRVNVDYPSIFFIPEAWVDHNESMVDMFDRIVNTLYPQAVS